MLIKRLWSPAQPSYSAAGGHSRISGLYSGFAQTTQQGRPTMTVIAITQNTPVLVAIDIAKARHEVSIAVAGKKWRRCWTFYQVSVTSVRQYSAGLVGLKPEMPVTVSLSRNFQPLKAVFSQWGIFFDVFIGFYVGSYQIVANWRVPAVLKWGYKSCFILGIGVLSGLPVSCLIRKNLIVCSEFDLVCCNDC